jgi:O-antigen/teichoic acid export membrane protein
VQSGQRVAVNSAVMVAKQIVMAVLGVVFVGYVARRLGVAAWGELQASVATAAVVGIFAGIGVRNYLAREIAVSPALGARHLGSALVIRGGSAALVLAVTVGISATQRSGLAATLLVIAAVSQLANTLYASIWMSFEAHERLAYIFYVELGARLFVIGGSVLLLAAGFGVVVIAATFAAGIVVELALSYWLVCARLYRPRLEVSALELWRIICKSLPFGLVAAQVSALQQIDTVLLRSLADEQSVGVFSAARVMTENLLLLPDALMTACFAAGMRLYAPDPDGFGRLYRTAMIVTLVLGLPIATGGYLIAPEIIEVVYGKGQYALSARVLRVLICGVPVAFAGHAAALPLLAAKRERVFAWILGCALAGNVLFNCALVPRYGALGSALATLITSSLTVACVLATTAKWVRSIGATRVTALAVATALMGVAAHLADVFAGMWGAIAAAAPLYVVLLFALRVVGWREAVALVRRRLPEGSVVHATN